jgi:hypothetical protein
MTQWTCTDVSNGPSNNDVAPEDGPRAETCRVIVNNVITSSFTLKEKKNMIKKFTFSLGQYSIAFQPEVYAIKATIAEITCKGYNNRSIYILCDSQAGIKALDNYQIISKLVWDCHQSLMKQADHKRVQLIQVSGHRGIEGNEIADQLATFRSDCPFIKPELECGI